MTFSSLAFFAIAMLTFTFPSNGLVYQTKDALVIEDSNSYQPSNPFVVKGSNNIYGAIPVHPVTGLLFGPPSIYQWLLNTVQVTDPGNPSPGSMPTPNTCGAGPMLDFDELRVVGGVDAEKNSWPGIVGLRYNGNFFCGGSLIAPDQILTAAHCLSWITESNLRSLTVDLGMHALDPSDAQVKRSVRRVTIHAGWNTTTYANDIAIVTLRTPVTYSSTISPVCLSQTSLNSQFTDFDAAIVAWGLTSAEWISNVLQQAPVNTITNAKCKESYSEISGSMICAVASGKNTCQIRLGGGGPLLIQSSLGSHWLQIGIASFGAGCANPDYPGVYSRVTSFRTWIRTHANV